MSYITNNSSTECPYLFIFSKQKLLVMKDSSGCSIPEHHHIEKLDIDTGSAIETGELHGRPCYAMEVEEIDLANSKYLLNDMRILFNILDEETFSAAFKAMHLLSFNSIRQFCSVCGSKASLTTDEEISKKCQNCGRVEYPNISPAIIVAITKGNKILLARNANFLTDFYSVLAGYVEPGESLEECVKREVKEEVGIEIEKVKYFGSQPWAFSNSLMIGFTAEYKTGDIEVDGVEISEAEWFSVDELPKIPGKISIAYRLINDFVEKQKKEI